MEYNKNNDVDPNPLFDIFFFFDIELKFFFKVRLLERKLYVAFLIWGWKKKKKEKKNTSDGTRTRNLRLSTIVCSGPTWPPLGGRRLIH